MARATTTAPRKAEAPKKPRSLAATILLSPFTISWKLLWGLLGAIVISIIVEWIGMLWIWPDQPDHAQQMLVAEMAYLGENFRTSITSMPPSEIVIQNVKIGYAALFESRLIKTLSNWQTTSSHSAIEYHLKKIVIKLADFVRAAAFIALVTIARMTIFILSSPWFVLCGMIGFVDGFVQRAIRTDEGGLEHGYLHHLSRRHAGMAFFMASVIYLASPWTINPAWILIPSGILFGANIYVIVWSFKKYL